MDLHRRAGEEVKRRVILGLHGGVIFEAARRTGTITQAGPRRSLKSGRENTCYEIGLRLRSEPREERYINTRTTSVVSYRLLFPNLHDVALSFLSVATVR
jgi:hypothetical protein